jgi:hypothetical protein
MWKWLGATTVAERHWLRERRSAGATTLTERISAGACSQQPVNGYDGGTLPHWGVSEEDAPGNQAGQTALVGWRHFPER